MYMALATIQYADRVEAISIEKAPGRLANYEYIAKLLAYTYADCVSVTVYDAAENQKAFRINRLAA